MLLKTIPKMQFQADAVVELRYSVKDKVPQLIWWGRLVHNLIHDGEYTGSDFLSQMTINLSRRWIHQLFLTQVTHEDGT